MFFFPHLVTSKIINTPVQEDGNDTQNDDSKAEKEIVDAATVANISSKKPGIDYFNNEESNPVKSNAMSKYSFLIAFGFLSVY